MIHGIEAEKNNTAETETTPITYLPRSAASFTSSAGKNISATSKELAFAINIGSGICSNDVKG